MSTEKPIEIISADITIGSRSVPVRDRIPRIPVMILAIIEVATITVGTSYMKTKQINAIHANVATADCHASVGIFSIRST